MGAYIVRSLCGEDSYLARVKRSWPVHDYGEKEIEKKKECRKEREVGMLDRRKSYGLIVFISHGLHSDHLRVRWLNLAHLDHCKSSSSIPCVG